MPAGRNRKWKGRPRIHNHYQVKIIYKDKEVFSRVYLDKYKAVAFANRQRKSPVVKNVTVRRLS